MKRKGLPWYYVLSAAMILCTGIIAMIILLARSPRRGIIDSEAEKREPSVQAVPHADRSSSFSIGNIIVRNSGNREISRCFASSLGSGWVVVSAAVLFGGDEVVFESRNSTIFSIDEFLWEEGDPVAFGKIDEPEGRGEYELTAWKEGIVMEWRALMPGAAPLVIRDITLDPIHRLCRFAAPVEAREPGLFIQEGKVVGWTFGEGTENGYIWTGAGGSDLVPNCQIGDISVSFSRRCREAYFALVLAQEMNTRSPNRLGELAGGFRMSSRYPQEDLPERLRSESVLGAMHSLADDLIKTGRAADVISILDTETLTLISAPIIVEDAVRAYIETYSYQEAVRFLEDFRREFRRQKGQKLFGLDAVHLQMYKDWLKKVIQGESYHSGVIVFERAQRIFPDDPDLHLLGVEAAVTERDWERAQEWLQMKDYPDRFRERKDRLENSILLRKGDEDVTVIRFDPSAEHIEVEAFLNRRHLQRFIIDTGATITSIPSSAFEALGFEVDEDTEVVVIQGVSGSGMTVQVTLDSLELANHRLNNVEVVVIDMEDYLNYGLLGKNVLDHFHVEIDSTKGILRLKR